MESKQRLIIVVERLPELQADLDFLHQEQVTLVNELVQLTNVDPDHTPAFSTEHRVGSPATANIKHTEEDATPITPQPSQVQSASYTSVNYNTSTEQLRVGEHIYIKNKISHSDRPNARDRDGIVTGIAHHPKKQVFVTTYSGVETWRSPLNVRRLTVDEKARLREQQDE